jgi:vancomycin resistance protein YoaR
VSKSKPKKINKYLQPALVVLAIIVLSITSFVYYFNDRIYPGIYISNVYVGGLTKTEATHLIEKTLQNRADKPLMYTYQDQSYKIEIANHYQTNLPAVVNDAFNLGHTRFYLPPRRFDLNLNLNPDFYLPLKNLEEKITIAPIESQIRIDNDEISVTPSQTGLSLDRPTLASQTNQYLNTGSQTTTQLPIITTYPKLSYQSALSIKNTLDQIKLTPLKLTYNDSVFTLDLPTLSNLIDYQNSTPSLISTKSSTIPFAIESITIGDTNITDNQIKLDPQKLNSYLSTVAKSIDRPVQEPLFQFDGLKVIEFKPPVIGQTLDRTKTANLITYALQTRDFDPIPLPVTEQQPVNKLSNDLGIKELIGSGQSDFSHSIENRIFNVKLAASRINGVLIPPNEEFSFVKYVGDIDAASGYKQAYVIKEGRTVLDDGGGVCQVSTTIFRAALNTGLPITARTAHAYRVGYYENDSPPGIDATIYSPTVDFKFKNDTGHHILIQTQVVGMKLTINIYGTSDGRITTMTKPVILSQTPPLPEIRQDDPTLPRGVVKQVDFAAWGANVVFTRKVIRNGQEIQNNTFRSNYRPWQAIYLVGTKD